MMLFSKRRLFLALGFFKAVFCFGGQTQEKPYFIFEDYHQYIPIAATTAAAGYLAYEYMQVPEVPVIQVKDLAVEKVNFPSNFLWGVATSSTQNEETSFNNTWSKDYTKTIPGKENVKVPSFACYGYQQWQDDIDKVAHLGCNSYRFSIEWSRVQPTIDSFDQSVIDHYVEIVKYCRDRNIQPMVCLHHYSDPIWFMACGGFTKSENIGLFTMFCKKMYEALRPYVNQWIVISQPVAYALKSYKVGLMPPYLSNSGLEDIVILNMFKAHIAVYDVMHNSYNRTKLGLNPQVGICHQIVQMKASRWWMPLDGIAAYFANRLNNETFLRFFKTGYLESLIPMKTIAYIPQAPTKFDFFALSYYSSLAFTGISAGAPMTLESLQAADGFRIIDKAGMYDAIVQASQLGKPIYVVENGINPKSEEQRKVHLNSYLSAISKAITDGYDVRSYQYWTLMDDYEWSNGKIFEGDSQPDAQFGLYKNRVINQKNGTLYSDFTDHSNMLKESGLYYKNIIALQQA
ncbi:glycoside hydrolase family 1 protein [Candidatus Babeliales bacterium]|nr:glycoside hydrolase family 1 protein [Candidatus Babeliales bacterium]MBP9843748.1 glycoside hydrolase family 1 protein [Candidatus Babeliales bacterium]